MLVIARDKELRRSIAFLLEAEGFDVSAYESVPSVGGIERRRCAVVDEDATVGDSQAWDRLKEISETIVLLLDRTGELPSDPVVRAVEKPFLGQNLVQAVRDALLQHPGLST